MNWPKIVVTPGATSSAEKSSLLTQAAKALNDLQGMGAYELWYDQLLDQFDVTYNSKSVSEDVVRKHLQHSLQRAQAKTHPNVTATLNENFTVEPAYGSGGNYGACTMGWVAYKGSKWGLLTADHCPPKTYYDGAHLKLYDRLPRHRGDGMIMEVVGGSGKPTPSLRWDWNKFTPVKGWREPVELTDFCKFGKTTGRTCSYITDTNKCVRYGKGSTLREYCNQIRGHGGYVLQPGDSGGPMFMTGALAVGFNSGYSGLQSAGQPQGQSCHFAKVSEFVKSKQFQIYTG